MLAAAGLGAACAHGAPRAALSPLPLVTGAFPQYGHAPDFAWVAGKLAPRPDGCVYLEFDPHHAPPWDGRIALIASPDLLDRFPSGDMIVVHGTLSGAPRGECAGAALDVTEIGEH